jgi:hypothetical protein
MLPIQKVTISSLGDLEILAMALEKLTKRFWGGRREWL